MPTVSEIISIAKVSQYLAQVDILNKGLFSGGIDSKLPRKIYCIRKNVEWLYGLDSTDSTLVKTANYLYALCAPYNMRATLIISGGAGGVVVNASTGISASYTEIRLQFVVGESGSLMAAGDTVLTLNYSNILTNSVIIFLDGTGELPTNRPERFSYFVGYGVGSTQIIFNSPVTDGMLFIIRFAQLINIGGATSSSSGGGGSDGTVYIGDL